MRTVPADQAFSDWRKLADTIRHQPVRVVGGTEGAMVVMSEAEYQKLMGQAWDRLLASMDRLSEEAKASGLTEEKLEELLADES